MNTAEDVLIELRNIARRYKIEDETRLQDIFEKALRYYTSSVSGEIRATRRPFAETIRNAAAMPQIPITQWTIQNGLFETLAPNTYLGDTTTSQQQGSAADTPGQDAPTSQANS